MSSHETPLRWMFHSQGQIDNNGTTRSYGSSISGSLRRLRAIFHYICSHSHPPTQGKRLSFPPDQCQCLLRNCFASGHFYCHKVMHIYSVISVFDDVSFTCWPFVCLFQRNCPVRANVHFNGSLILICFESFGVAYTFLR